MTVLRPLRILALSCRRPVLLLLLLPLLLLPVAAAMSRSEATRELGLPRTGTITPQQLKAAYRKRSLETHPDKGGSDEAFVLVAEAYEELSSSSSSGGGGRRGDDSSGSGAGATDDMDDRMRKAEEMFDDIFDSLFDEDTVGEAVDSLFDQFGGGEGKKKLGVVGKMCKSFVKWVAPKFMKLLESEGSTITVNGKSMSGTEFKEWRAQRKRARRDDDERIAGENTDL